MKILYIENHARFAKITASQFLSGHDVTIVPSLSTARQILAQNAFDVLLVDYDLDDGKGDELVKELREQGSPVDIIAVSAHQPGNSALLGAGANAVCNKLKFSEIEKVLAQLRLRG